MRTKFFFFAMLISVAAGATVKVTPLATDYSIQKVTFKVEWTNLPTAPHNNRVWVWIDFCPITGTTPATSFSTATVSNPTKTGGNGTVTNATARGFFIEYDAINAGTTITAVLSNASGKFNWCAYGSDYPPNVLANTNGSYTLAGTPPFKLTAANGTTTQTINEKIIAASDLSLAPVTITDATGYPGLWCPYTGSDLYMDDTHRCLQRQAGAYNWEAWIKDSRDEELYRIVYMPDNKWWLAQNVKFEGTGEAVTTGGCTPDKCGRRYTGAQMSQSWGGTSGYGSGIQGVCPNGWILPVNSDYASLTSSISATASVVAARLEAELSICSGGNNYYGWANVIGVSLPTVSINSGYECWRTNNSVNWEYGLFLNHIPNSGVMTCGALAVGHSYANLDRVSPVRCFRQL
jgi:uncharacterized protein (TIGR02145 family)